MKKIITAFAAMLIVLSSNVMAQSGTNSPYSMYGLGVLADRSQGFNRGMSGVAQGMSDGNQINTQNPASYANVDSLSFIFDIGMSLLNTNLQEGGNRMNAKTANYEYGLAAFRIAKNLGCSFGILPYSNIGYNFYQTGTQKGAVTDTYTTTYYGEGGLRDLYLGFGWRPVKYLAVGVNGSYVWGSYNKTVTSTHSVSSASSLVREYNTDIHSYKFDIGAQAYIPLDKKQQLTIGATYTIGHNLGNEATVYDIKTDTTTYQLKDALAIPNTLSLGLAWKYKNTWKVGADFTLYKFGKLQTPILSDNGSYFTYTLKDGYLMDKRKISIGAEWLPDEYALSLLKRIRYRVGGFFSTPYIKVTDSNGSLVDGPKEVGLSFGFGIPIMNSYNNRSIINISGQWVKASLDNYIKENYFRINVGITFNERWFAKWKFE